MSTARKRLALVTAVALSLAGMSVVTATSAQAACSTYYVSPTGSDSNTGCSTSAPWQSLAQVNATTFAAGAQVLFQDGGSWTGTLHPLGSGTSGSPIVVSNYGSGSAPIIAGAGAAEAVYLDNQSYVTIENLEITNTAATAAVRSGIEVQNDTSGILSGISIIDNDIHDVLGYWSSSEGVQPTNSSGIAFNLNDSSTTNGWNGVTIQGNTLTNTDVGAIYLGSLNGTGHNIATSNVVIENNTITNAGGNDIVCVYCASPLVQYNVASASGWRYSGAGLWTALSTNGVWQYNEVTDQGRAGSDGEAFDIDHGTSGTILQYNYSHANPYGFQEYCCGGSTGAATSIVRYNISQNDGASNSVLPHQAYVGTGSTANFYNNTIYLSASDNAPIYGDAAPTGLNYDNNIFYKLGTGGYGTGGTWSHNVFYGNHPTSEPSDTAKLTTDPLFSSPGGGGNGLASAAAYELQGGSPALGSGELISGNGGLDFFGNAVSSTAAPNRGAYNGSGVSAATLRGYWTFDEGTGTTAADSSGSGHTGTLEAGASWTTGVVGAHAVSLTGASNSYVDVPGPVVDTSQSYTAALWVKLNSVTGSNQTFTSIDGTNISPFYLQLTSGKFAFVARSSDSTSSTATQVTATSAATAGTWYQVTGVYDNSAHTLALYVDGTLQGTASFSSPWTASGDTVIGRAKWKAASVDFTNGAIDDVHLYAQALSASAVAALAAE
ncbi:hypothetical protein KDL01_00620 [Actinospica durhamensis]|uniref:LamG-like jellyroll fold domain-containing protein n=1 Tax=Actinospica durhamensis TaxID=1508375 RepID=A0A941EQ67_9ACTN|nr:LamG-like jellyroll fold domain-containing protein [Actinospica durhamensis]MBR7831739.1 hypothetical protein [Actinospica durhamensis]